MIPLKSLFRSVSRAASLLLVLAVASSRADTPANLSPVGVGLGGFSYYTSGPFADTAKSGANWLEYGSGQWGAAVPFYDDNGIPNPQFNARGLPNYLNPGLSLRLLLWPYSVNSSNRPATWPARGNTGAGKWVVTWTGDADIRLVGATFVAAESSGASTGALVDGRRVYQMAATNPSGHITIATINAPVTDLKVWLPDPADPTNQSMETSGQFWHPDLLGNLAEMDLAFLRFMDWGNTNASPLRDWSDRRSPDFAFQRGVLNRRSPATGYAGARNTGIAYEHMVALANAAGRDMWICVPHMATDTFVINLANLIRHGSDGVNPYTSPQADPVHPPLDPGLKVWLEYSNEIWSSGNNFPQGNWAQEQANLLGITKPQFNARRAAQIWSLFQQQFGGSERIVRVAAIFTASESYTLPFLNELNTYAPTLSPAVEPDIISPTTYFGNGIQNWAYEQANLRRGTDRQWFHTAADFVYSQSTGATRPVSVPLTAGESYWTSPELAGQQAETFAEWRRRIFSGSTQQGGGPDSTGTGGGFSSSLRDNIQLIFGRHIPLVSYEGGPSLYTDSMDGADSRDDGITNFMAALNRQPEFAEIYRIQLNIARSKGLHTHGLFVDVARPGKYGQWGHREYQDQPFIEAIKWAAVADWAMDMENIRNIDDPVGARPSFVTPGTLPIGQHDTPYAQDIEVTGGDYTGTPDPHLTVIGSQLLPGLALAPVPGDPWKYRVSGTPAAGGWSYFYLRAHDDDGDAAWQIYSFYVAGGPDVLVEADLAGPFAGAADLPKDDVQAISPQLTWTGLDRGMAHTAGGGTATGTDGRGVNVFSDTDAILFSVSQGTTTATVATLASAIADHEYWTFTVTPEPGSPLNLRKAEFLLTWLRTAYHAPRKLAVMTSVGGFSEADAIYMLASTPSSGAVSEVKFLLPDAAAYENLTTPVEFRVYFYASQYSHKAQLLGLKLSRDPDAAVHAPTYQLSLESDFTGADPAQNLPWTPAATLDPDLTYSGWFKGAGITVNTGDDHIRVFQNMPALEADATLALAINDNEYLGFTIAPTAGTLDLRAADIAIALRRIKWHAPRRFAVFTSVDGFASGTEVFDTGRFTSRERQNFTFQLPDTAAYNGLTGPVEFRIYGYSGQYYAHDFALEAFSLSLFK